MTRAAVAVAVAVAVVALAGCGSESVSERVSAFVDSEATCEQWGLQVLAGERETVYDCVYRLPESTLSTFNAHDRENLIEQERISGGTRICVAIIDGDVNAQLGKCDAA